VLDGVAALVPFFHISSNVFTIALTFALAKYLLVLLYHFYWIDLLLMI